MGKGKWPDKIWAPWQENADPETGMANYNKPLDARTARGTEKGLPKNWRNKKDEAMKADAWDVIGAPGTEGNELFAVAAEALDIDWDEFRADLRGKIGKKKDYEIEEGDEYGDKDYDWGIGTKYGNKNKQLDKMRSWLEDATKVQSTSRDDVIQEGLSLADFGIKGKGNIWEYYGLDKPPEPPTESDVQFEGTEFDKGYSLPISITPHIEPHYTRPTQAYMKIDFQQGEELTPEQQGAPT